MRDHNESYHRYRQGDARLAEELAEKQRAAEEAVNWESHRQWLRECGTLDTVERIIGDFHRMWISIARERGMSRRDAKLYADARITDLRWLLATDPPLDAVARRMHAWRSLGKAARPREVSEAGVIFETSAH